MFLLVCAVHFTAMELVAMERTTAVFPSRRFGGTKAV